MKRAVYVSAKAYVSNAEKAEAYRGIMNNAESIVKEKTNPVLYTVFMGVLILIPWFFIIGILAVLGLGFSWKIGGIVYGVLTLLIILIVYFSRKSEDINESKTPKLFEDESTEKKEVELVLTTLGVEIGEDAYTWDEIESVVEFEDWLIFTSDGNCVGIFKIADLKERKQDRLLSILENKDLLYQIFTSDD